MSWSQGRYWSGNTYGKKGGGGTSYSEKTWKAPPWVTTCSCCGAWKWGKRWSLFCEQCGTAWPKSDVVSANYEAEWPQPGQGSGRGKAAGGKAGKGKGGGKDSAANRGGDSGGGSEADGEGGSVAVPNWKENPEARAQIRAMVQQLGQLLKVPVADMLAEHLPKEEAEVQS